MSMTNTFKTNLKSIRKIKLLTQQDMADKLGITRQGYALYENGEYSPSLDKIEKIAQTLNIKPYDLLQEHKDKQIEITKELREIYEKIKIINERIEE